MSGLQINAPGALFLESKSPKALETARPPGFNLIVLPL